MAEAPAGRDSGRSDGPSNLAARGGGSIRSRQGEGRSASQNGLARKSARRKGTGGAAGGWTGTI